MEKYVVLLRGINVGKNHHLAMQDLKNVLEQLGYSQVKTYIRSGNAVMTGPIEDTTILAERIQQKLSQFAGFLIPIILYTEAEFLTMVTENPLTKRELAANEQWLVAYQQQIISANNQLSKEMNEEIGFPFKKAVFIKIIGSQTDSPLLKEYQKVFKGGNWTVRNWNTTLKLVQFIQEIKIK
ncbi:DUF1697 domain-containing protein [Carnobacterium gallinarum]|uniref:DUF1697 domain-containing protein n=1 Tax=Carnobacterium gallinarum TaxID=2749 RepID=UPI00054EFF8D|nr:DUF1697 domain-containing protein [Carnobacterium gallinarum]